MVGSISLIWFSYVSEKAKIGVHILSKGNALK